MQELLQQLLAGSELSVQKLILVRTRSLVMLNSTAAHLGMQLAHLRLHGHSEELLQKLLQASEAGPQGQVVVGARQLGSKRLILHPAC